MKVKSYIFSFSKENVPVCEVNENEIITFVCKDCFCGQVQDENVNVEDIDESLDNPATGPVYVKNAKKGDVLAVEILDIRIDKKGVAIPMSHCGPKDVMCEEKPQMFEIVDNCLNLSKYGISWEMEPMVGVIGCAHDEKDIPTVQPGEHGGNMDCKMIKKGSTVYLPIRVDGALLAMGDIHACMGDGEMCGTGLEIAGEIDVKVRIIPSFDLRWPASEYNDVYYVHTNGETCDQAISKAYIEMRRLIMNAYKMSLEDAIVYMSLRGDLCANQACLTPNNGGNTFRIGTPKIKDKPLFGGK